MEKYLYSSCMALIFVVEDNEGIRDGVKGYLELHEHRVLAFENLKSARRALDGDPPNLLILDIMLPDGDSRVLAREVRRDRIPGVDAALPIIFITAKGSESDRITGFEIGADDYIVKPFSSRELVLRVEALLRRVRDPFSGEQPDEGERSWKLKDSVIKINDKIHRVTLNEENLDFTSAEWRILFYLAVNSGMVISREKILNHCLDYNFEAFERLADTHIKNIRAKLEDKEWIETVRGFGYRFMGEEE
jgi:DNA-binding response OmpR family regulator